MPYTDRGLVTKPKTNFSDMDKDFFLNVYTSNYTKRLVKIRKTKNQDHFTRRRFLNHEYTRCVRKQMRRAT